MATLLLLRHGRTTANATAGLAGRSPVGLDETGQAQAGALRERLREVPLAAVVTSPLVRCRETVARVVPAADPVVEERLTECGYGDWEGRPLGELAEDPLWPVVQQHPAGVRFPGEGGEAMAGMAARAVAAVRDWDARATAAAGEGAVWLACSHGDVIKAVVADALGLHLDLFQRLVVEPGSVTVIRYTRTRPFLLRLGDPGPLAVPPPPADAAGGDAAVGGGDVAAAGGGVAASGEGAAAGGSEQAGGGRDSAGGAPDQARFGRVE